MAKLVVITDVNPAELAMVLDKVLDTSSCPLKGMHGVVGMTAMSIPMGEVPQEIKDLIERLDPSKKNKGKSS